MKDGLYRYTRRDGRVLIAQFTKGACTEIMELGVGRERPKRLTRRRLGDSLGQVRAEARERRRREQIMALYGDRLA